MLNRIICFCLILLLLLNMNSVFAIDEVVHLHGKIAFIGTDHNIYTYNTESEIQTQLTVDADSLGNYQWTTWSRDGRLAFFCCETTPYGQVYVSSDGESTPELAYENPGSFVIYASWAPANCGDDCRELALLLNSNQGLSVDVLTDSSNSTTETIATGSPFYFHWDSTGTQMLFHRDGASLEIYNRDANDISASLESSSGQFQAPMWSPVDDRVLVGLRGSSPSLTNLTVINGNATTILAEDIEGLISFLWSPNGRYVAYRTINSLGLSSITVIDVNSGVSIPVADNTGAIAFFWSPDSRKIAYVTFDLGDEGRSAKPLASPNQNFVQDDIPTHLRWHVLHIEAQTNMRYIAFIPTYEMVYLLTYFDQFAPSHQLWSPDSRYLVFPGALTENQSQPRIYVMDTEDARAELNPISDGRFAIWSFE